MQNNFEISVCSYGAGNPASVVNMISKIGYKSKLCVSSEEIIGSKVTILPGVGSFDFAINRLRKNGWDKAISRNLNSGGYLLGICLGMQLLCEKSEEGELKGLSLLPGEFRKFKTFNKKFKVPHMGWNNVVYSEKFPLKKIYDAKQNRYYFVHSFYYHNDNNEFVLGTTNYSRIYASVIGLESLKILGVQFHPEKSHKFGMEFFKNYFSEVR